MALESQPEDGERAVSLAGVSAFMRQLAHDLHNDLNSLDLAATYIGEIVESPVAKGELTTQRETIRGMGRMLHALSSHLQTPHPDKMILSAEELVGGFRERLSQSHPVEAAAVSWSSDVGACRVEADPGMICGALAEVFKNALLYRDKGAVVAFSAAVRGGKLRLQFSEKKAVPPEELDRLGIEPFVVVKRRSYGLGLFYAARVARAHGGGLEARHDVERGLFTVEIILPAMEAEPQTT